MKEKVSTGTIVRDCTGTYLRTGANEDYLVCNAQMLVSKKAGEKVWLTYVDAKECKENESFSGNHKFSKYRKKCFAFLSEW